MAGLWQRAMSYLGLSDDDSYGDYEPYEDQQPAQPARRAAPPPSHEPEAVSVVRPPSGGPLGPSNDVSGVSGISVQQPRPSSVRTVSPVPQVAKVHVVAPTTFGDAKEIGERFRSGQPVFVNLQGVDRDLTRRIVDFASGLVFALNGGMEKVADKVYMLTPSNVEVSADERRRLQERGLYRP